MTLSLHSFPDLRKDANNSSLSAPFPYSTCLPFGRMCSSSDLCHHLWYLFGLLYFAQMANFCRFYVFYCTEIHENGGNTRARPTWLNHCKFKWLSFVKIAVFTLKLPKWKKWWKMATHHTQICRLGPKFATNKYQVYSSMFLILRYIHNIL